MTKHGTKDQLWQQKYQANEQHNYCTKLHVTYKVS